MTAGTALRWVFFDAHGTLITLDRIFERLQANLAARGHSLALSDVEYATRREFEYYLAHHYLARDSASLRRLRLECAAVLLEALRERGHRLTITPDEMADALVGALSFRLYADVWPTLHGLRSLGIHVGLISNWDCSLPEILAGLGLLEYLEVVVVSALCGCEKPDPRLFAEALRRAQAAPEAALHVGDSCDKDVVGARAVGMRALLLDRGGQPSEDVPIIRELTELLAIVAA